MEIEAKLKVLYQLKQEKIVQANCLANTEALIEKAQEEIVDEFQSRQLQSLKIKGIGNFFLSVSHYPRVVDPQQLRMWMEKNGYPWDILTAYNANKFKGWWRELMENKQPLPEGCENFTEANLKFSKEGEIETQPKEV